MTTEFTVFGHFNSQPATRVVLFLSMADTPFSYRHVDLRGGAQKQPEYLAINRFGRVPALVHGDVRLAESGVILTYLAEQTGRFGGRDQAERLSLAEWLSWLGDGLLPIQRARALRRFQNDPSALPYLDRQAVVGVQSLERHLAAGPPFIAGDRVTIADIFAFPWLDLAEESALDLTPYPAVLAWLARMKVLPGVKSQYDLMPKSDIN